MSSSTSPRLHQVHTGTEAKTPQAKRVRTAQGSCWSCKQRRIKCTLTKPCCNQCKVIGAECVYSNLLIRWSTRPNAFQALVAGVSEPCPITLYQKRALEYFEHRLWPLFTVDEAPCSVPLDTTIKDKTVLQAVCVIADAHRYLLDKRQSESNVQLRRVDALASIRRDLCQVGLSEDQQKHLLSAILILYFLDGYIDCNREHAATSSHQVRIRAMINNMGGAGRILATANDALRLLISEFAAADLSAAIFRGVEPYFPCDAWPLLSAYRVWWASTGEDALKLGLLFQNISAMVFYGKKIQSSNEAPSAEQVTTFEATFCPTYSLIAYSEQFDTVWKASSETRAAQESVLRGEFYRIFQHAANIYLYRVICRYPPVHCLVQQHVCAAIGKVLSMEDDSKEANCVLLPLRIVGAHLENEKLQQRLFHKLELIHQSLKFESVDCVKHWLSKLWELESLPEAWTDLFQDLNQHAVVI
ncbi:hypothetical protein FANTH_13964 [Fusarium anthophilum]|uniref:Zn(2)-C6 fungal-type domain-containing protein n=1 Tax=Fusarium anthophilum TaxID=48485 RepID=A0A8H5DNI7_9HYPO|nr:hypothetical protein FANTH_13964 [Fusarium anthophilum]